jgi:hypothetical protein
MKKYVMVIAKSLQELEDLVNTKLTEGYRLAEGSAPLVLKTRKEIEGDISSHYIDDYTYIREMTYY